MHTIEISNLHTLVLSLAAAVLGELLCRRVRLLERLTVPAAVVGGLLFAVVVAVLRWLWSIEIHMASGMSEPLLLVFFTTIGLSAKLSALKAGGRPLVILCAITVLLLFVQNLAGVLIARAWGAHPFYGLLAGSISFMGGPGTAAAWAQEAQAKGLANAPLVGVAAATFAVIAGAIAAGPITGWMIRRHRLGGKPASGTATPSHPSPPASDESAAPITDVMSSLLLVAIAVAIGETLNTWGRGAGLLLPGFLTAMFAGVLITNTAGPLRIPITMAPIQAAGELSLRVFLAMYLMSLQLWLVGAAIAPLAVNVVVQVGLSAAIAWLILFRALGRDYDAAVAAGGVLGFGVSSMPVAMATMEQVGVRYGPSPRAVLVVTLAGSFFVDLANAVVVQTLLKLPLFR
jgi:ESS family glutamate:Na+ symporter